MRKLLALGAVLLLAGCGEVPENQMSNAEVEEQLIEEAESNGPPWASRQQGVGQAYEPIVVDLPDGRIVTCVVTDTAMDCDWDGAVAKVAE